MRTAPPSSSETDRVSRMNDFVNASLLLDEWLDWMPSLCGQVEGFEEPFFVRSRIPRLALVPRLEPPPDEEDRNRVVAYGLSFFAGWHDPVRDAVSTWSHLLIVSSGSAGAVRSSLIREVDPSTGESTLWMSVPNSVVDPSEHEAVLGWFAVFADHVRILRLPTLFNPDSGVFHDNRCWHGAPRFESRFESWSWNRNDAARLAAIMECERRILFQAWKHKATAESLPEYRELWYRDRRLSQAVVETIGKLSEMDREILSRLLSAQPQTTDQLSHSIDGPNSTPSGSLTRSLKGLKALECIQSGGRGRPSAGYCLKDLGMQVADALRQMAPPSSVQNPS